MADDDCYYIMRPGNSDAGCVTILSKTTDWETYEDIDLIALPNNRVPCLFPEKINGMYMRLDRPYTFSKQPHNNPQMGFIWLSESPDLLHWGKHRLLLKPWSRWNLTPDRDYELNGRTPNVVFPCGAIGDLEKDSLRVYYGGADTCIGIQNFPWNCYMKQWFLYSGSTRPYQEFPV